MSQIDPDKHFDTVVSPILTLVGKEVDVLDVVADVLHVGQALVQRPTLDEVARMRAGTLPLTKPAYAIGRLQRAILHIENAASDLRLDAETGFDLSGLELADVDFNAIEAALARFSSEA